MDIWDKDPLNDFVKSFLVDLGASVEFPEKVNAFNIARDNESNIILHVFSHASDHPKRKDIPLGLVYNLDNSVELKGYIGSGELLGISGFSVNTAFSNNNSDTATESKYTINQVNYSTTDLEIEYTVDQIANLPDHYLWSSSITDKISGQHERTFTGNSPIEITTSTPSTHNMSRTSARFELGGHSVVISTMKSSSIPKSRNPGYIYYSGHPSKEIREKIRASLSLTFGLPLVYFGSSFYTQNGGVVGFEAVSPSTVGGRAWRIVSQPFAPITVGMSNMLDGELLQKNASSFFENYDSMDLRGFLFRLWYAEVSPTHMKAAYYGAMIESIQKREIEKLDSKISNTIIAKAEYRKTIKILSKFLQKQNIPLLAKELLSHKIQDGNKAPQRILAERFYSTLGLCLGPVELTAWLRRNDAAHGNEDLPGSEIRNYRSNKILRVILGRIILKLSGSSSNYIDYYTYGHPIRELSDAIPHDEV